MNSYSHRNIDAIVEDSLQYRYWCYSRLYCNIGFCLARGKKVPQRVLYGRWRWLIVRYNTCGWRNWL